MFLVFEGLDGCGKSTLMNGYREFLEKRGQKVFMTREPGGTPLGENLRDVLLTIKENKEFKISPRAELLLYEASRAQHVDQVILKKLEQGMVVLCDRFTASSVAFQAGGRTLSMEQVKALNEFAIAGCQPTANIFIDLDYEHCQRRKSKMNEALDRLESEKADFHHRVYQSYKEQVRKNPKDWIVVNGMLSPEMLVESLAHKISERPK